MFFKKKKTNMELEIAEQVKIIPEILLRYLDSDTNNINIDTSELNNDNDSERLIYNTTEEWDLEVIPHSGIFVSLYCATIS